MLQSSKGIVRELFKVLLILHTQPYVPYLNTTFFTSLTYTSVGYAECFDMLLRCCINVLQWLCYLLSMLTFNGTPKPLSLLGFPIATWINVDTFLDLVTCSLMQEHLVDRAKTETGRTKFLKKIGKVKQFDKGQQVCQVLAFLFYFLYQSRLQFLVSVD